MNDQELLEANIEHYEDVKENKDKEEAKEALGYKV